MMRLFFGIVATLMSTAAVAGSADVGSVAAILPMTTSSSLFFFNQSGTRYSPPGCASLSVRWVIPTNSPAGQSAAALVMLAYSMRKRVWVSGTGACSLWGDTETVNWVTVED